MREHALLLHIITQLGPHAGETQPQSNLVGLRWDIYLCLGVCCLYQSTVFGCKMPIFGRGPFPDVVRDMLICQEQVVPLQAREWQ